jgi:hypothetical protein
MAFLGIGEPNEQQVARREAREKRKTERRSTKPRVRKMMDSETERLKIEAGLKETEAITDVAKLSNSGNSNMIWYVLGGVVLIGGVYYFMRKKK